MRNTVSQTGRWVRAVAALTAFTVAGCGATGPTRLKMKFDVSRKANDDHPLMVDIVVAYDPELVDDLDRLTASEWFGQREQRIRNNPGETSFNTWRWELTPGLEISAVDVRLRGVPAQGLLFADYSSRGKHSARFDPNYAQTVQFRHDAFRVVAGKLNSSARSWRPPVGWSLVGVGLVGVALGTYFAFEANDAAQGTVGLKPVDRELHNQLVSDVDSFETGMFISYGIGATLVLAGATVLLWPESNESPFRNVPSTDETTDASVIRW